MLVRQWEARLLYYVRRLVATEEDAWDVMQETWLRVYKGIRSLQSPEHLSTWLYRVARCAAQSHWRGHYRAHERLEDSKNLEGFAAEEEDPLGDAEQVHRALGRISLLHREVLTLFFLEDLSQEQMAEVLGVPLGTVKSRLCYAKRALRFVLQREEGFGMKGASGRFREELLAAEPITPALQERYHEGLQAMLSKQLHGMRRWIWVGVSITGLGFAAFFGTLAVVLPAEFPWSGRLIFAAGAFFGIGWGLLGLKVSWRGSLDLRSDTWAANGMAWALPVLVVTVAMVSAPDNVVGLRMILCALVFLVMGAAFLMRHVVEQSELKTREKLLEIEYRLAELTDRMKPGRPRASDFASVRSSPRWNSSLRCWLENAGLRGAGRPWTARRVHGWPARRFEPSNHTLTFRRHRLRRHVPRLFLPFRPPIPRSRRTRRGADVGNH